MNSLHHNNWTYHGKASDFERYIFNEDNSLLEMQNLLASSIFVLQASDNLLFCLFNEKDSFENFKQISNLLSMILGPKILKFSQIDDVDFYIQGLHLFINCLNCYATCYGEDMPVLLKFGGIISGDNCRIFKFPPSEEEPPPPPPPQSFDPLNFVIQNYPTSQLEPVPGPTPEQIIIPSPNDDALHMSLWLPCQGNVNLYSDTTDNILNLSKYDTSRICPDNNPNDDVDAYFYRVSLDRPNCRSWGCMHEMFEVKYNGIYLRREIMGNNNYYCKNNETGESGNFDYRHHDEFVWFKRPSYNPDFFVEYHNEECWKTGGVSDNNNCNGLSSINSDVPHLEVYSHPNPEDPSSNGGPTAIYLFQMQIPDPSHSQNPEYCNYIGRFPENLNYNCPSPYIKIANDKVGIICYEGPTITVKVLVRVQYWGNMGTSNMDCGKEIYYYANPQSPGGLLNGSTFLHLLLLIAIFLTPGTII